MKKLLFIAAAIFLLPFIGMKGTPAGNPVASLPQSSSRAANAPAKSSGQSGYISPTPGRFPIIAYSPNTNVYVRPTDGADIPEYDGPVSIKKLPEKGFSSRGFTMDWTT